MREPIHPQSGGRNGTSTKEISLRIHKSGLNATGNQRHVVAIGFHYDSHKKASSTNRVVPEIDWEASRLFFVSNEQGFKLSGDKGVKTISFTVDDVEKWRAYIGDYDLLKDFESGDYYIDLSKK